MARIRTIKPDAFVSESLAELSLAAERTFFGLWTQADDAGRVKDRPGVLNGALWPLRTDHNADAMEADLAALAQGEQICRYEVDGQRLLHVVGWDEHQSINKPSQSPLPPCPTHGASKYDRSTQLDKWREAGLFTPPAGSAAAARSGESAGTLPLEVDDSGKLTPQRRQTRAALAAGVDAAASMNRHNARPETSTEGSGTIPGGLPEVSTQVLHVDLSPVYGTPAFLTERRGPSALIAHPSPLCSPANPGPVATSATPSGNVPGGLREDYRGEREKEREREREGKDVLCDLALDEPTSPLTLSDAAHRTSTDPDEHQVDGDRTPTLTMGESTRSASGAPAVKAMNTTPPADAPTSTAPDEPGEAGATERVLGAEAPPTASADRDTEPQPNTPTRLATDDLTGEDDMGLYDQPVDPFAPPATSTDDKPAKSSRVKYEPNPEYAEPVEKLCDYLAARVRRNLTERQAARVQVTDRWRRDCERLMRLDGYTPAEVSTVITWATQDAFWRVNIRSMENLREHMTRMTLHRDFINWCKANGKPLIATDVDPAPTRPVRAVDRPTAQKDYTTQLSEV